MALEDFLQRFKTVMDALMAHPQVRLTHVWIGPAASDAQLEVLARAWDRPVPAELATLYRQANGLQLRWVDAAHETYDPSRDDGMSLQRTETALWDVGGFAAGVLDLPTLEELAERDRIAQQFDSDEPHLQHAVVFESFGESQDSVLFLDSVGADPALVVASDYLADVPEPDEGTLSRYLAHTLATWCAVWHRHEDGPRPLDSLLRRRVPVDPTRLVGQRVLYEDEGRSGSIMRGRVVSLADAPTVPRWWDFGRTFAQVEDDFGELIHVPMRSLFPPDPSDAYERLHDDHAALLDTLAGSPAQLFEALAPVAEARHRLGLPDGPSLSDASWPLAALCARVPPALLVAAADRLMRAPEGRSARAVRWAPNPPRRPLHPTLAFHSLGRSLLDVLLILAARKGVTTLTPWLGPAAAAQLRALLQLESSREPLRGYNPLTDRSNTLGYLQHALDGEPIQLDVGPRGSQRGADFGLAALRLIRPADYDSPAC